MNPTRSPLHAKVARCLERARVPLTVNEVAERLDADLQAVSHCLRHGWAAGRYARSQRRGQRGRRAPFLYWPSGHTPADGRGTFNDAGVRMVLAALDELTRGRRTEARA